ncbi:flagellar biosynthesis anti-sigma factor FlgM [Coralloluteibacterium stylophorae]|uniref:Negative regulator of flagellin synthesis n=1 Tax=Coralloluteibacterium stylophorae TaxID=1776034 RepID=A0A8J8AYW2_9GAMM|nr:flagellar biosynthesis anti-sigma factor FlgM [Coralloluteibacterium stylophorae]MBS7457191.1 flagellar biosynthesis anti-sigma factor FlgM [Coralloluteibacterium stylophorae]
MSNKIEGAGMSNIYRLQPTARQDIERAGSERSAPVGATPAADSVRLSSEGASLQALQQRQDVDAPFDGAKVAALRSAIESGSYRIDAGAIAGRLVDLESALG